MIRLLTVLLTLSLSLSAQKFPGNIKHFIAGTVITWAVGDVTYQLTDRLGVSVFTGIGAGIGAGLGKEYLWDGKMQRGVKSSADWIETSFGSMTGGFGFFVSIRMRKETEEKRLARLKRDFEE